MITQEIFKGLSPNWRWASLSSSGTARVHAEKPSISSDNVVLFRVGQGKSALRKEFDTAELPPEGLQAQIIERLEPFASPNWETDGHGCPLPPIHGVPPLPPVGVLAAPQTTTLTTDEAEAGRLWDFACTTENYVSVNTFGVVWFNSYKEGPEPRRSYAVQVTGVTHVIERTRSQPVPTCNAFCCEADALPGSMCCAEHAEPGQYRSRPEPVPLPNDPAPVAPAYEDDGRNNPSEVYSADQFANLSGMMDDLEVKFAAAKARAKKLLVSYVHDGQGIRTAINELQYMAIFGESSE